MEICASRLHQREDSFRLARHPGLASLKDPPGFTFCGTVFVAPSSMSK